MIEAWQEAYRAQDQTVTIGPKESKAISFTFRPSDAVGDEDFEWESYFTGQHSSHDPIAGMLHVGA